MKIKLFTFIILFIASALHATPDSLKTFFQEANTAYNQQNYSLAIEKYQTLLDQGYHSAELYYNMGNAYFRNNQNSFAILFYEKALLENPRHEAAKHNLKIANANIKDKIEVIPAFFLVSFANFIQNLFPTDTWAIFSLISFFILLLSIAVFFFAQSSGMRKLGFFVGVFFFMVFALDIWAAQAQKNQNQNHQYAIILEPAITVKSAPTQQGTDLFLLHEGTKVKIINQKMLSSATEADTENLTNFNAEWYEIKLSDGKIGWIPSNALKRI